MTAAAVEKKPGLFYARTDDGSELPVIDVTHPVFAVSLRDDAQRALVERFMRERQPLSRLPGPVRKLLWRLLARRSKLVRGIGASAGTFMAGMTTYLLKLGPDSGVFTNEVDRKIAAHLSALAVRLRLQDMARLLADALAPELAAAPGRPLHLLAIAGGPAMDDLNALILLGREQPQALAGRPVTIEVLDQDTAGPAFGARALAALQTAGGPLHGLEISFRHTPYDWSRAEDLQPILQAARQANALIAASSEGGLFEYGSDQDIVSNLARLGREAFVVVGSVTRADEPVRRLLSASAAALRPRGLAVFREIVRHGGWTVARAIERPFSDHVALTRAAS